VPVPAPVVAVAPAQAPPTLFQSAEATVFWPLAEEAVVLSVAAIPRAVQRPPQQEVWAMDSATRAVWESEHWLVSPPVGPTWVEAPRRVVAMED
jgi:hypothetical protein